MLECCQVLSDSTYERDDALDLQDVRHWHFRIPIASHTRIPEALLPGCRSGPPKESALDEGLVSHRSSA